MNMKIINIINNNKHTTNNDELNNNDNTDTCIGAALRSNIRGE